MMEPAKRLIRCAIYTRKSSEEGLEQSFNSLDAQREACQAYILSQRQEGWRPIQTLYDDGGYSGGSMQRPALASLLRDIDARKVDTVVVYKVDRLTRSLADFAKIIEAFDARGVSFVSVTQQFNTTSSMGRLTLNVLLSFAQFEREVTGERIRDKIAASKRKGMWMGGRVPLGYDLKDHHLVVNPEEAQRVREIFTQYLRAGCVKRLKADLDGKGIRSKIRTSQTGRRSGGAAYSRGALYKILQNRIYLGEVAHKDLSHPGQHDRIIDGELWDRVQAKLKENACVRRHGTNASAPSLLRGLVFSPEGHRFTPSHAVKNGKRYRYYVSQSAIEGRGKGSDEPRRIPARELEEAVMAQLRDFLGSGDQVLAALDLTDADVGTTRKTLYDAREYADQLGRNMAAGANELLTNLCCRIIIHRDSIEIRLPKRELHTSLGQTEPLFHIEDDSELEWITLEAPAKLLRCGGEMRMIVPPGPNGSRATTPIPSLLKAISRAHDWVARIESGGFKDQRAIAAATGLDERYISQILPAAFLAPELVEAIVDGRHTPGLTLSGLLNDISLEWKLQRVRLLEKAP